MTATCKYCKSSVLVASTEHCAKKKCVKRAKKAGTAVSISLRAGTGLHSVVAPPSQTLAAETICQLRRCDKKSRDVYCKEGHAREAVAKGEAVACAFCKVFPITPGFAYCSRNCGRQAEATLILARRMAARNGPQPSQGNVGRGGSRSTPVANTNGPPITTVAGPSSESLNRVVYQPCGCTLNTRVWPPPPECPVCSVGQNVVSGNPMVEEEIEYETEEPPETTRRIHPSINVGDIVSIDQRNTSLAITTVASPRRSNSDRLATPDLDSYAAEDCPPAYEELASPVALEHPTQVFAAPAIGTPRQPTRTNSLPIEVTVEPLGDEKRNHGAYDDADAVTQSRDILGDPNGQPRRPARSRPPLPMLPPGHSLPELPERPGWSRNQSSASGSLPLLPGDSIVDADTEEPLPILPPVTTSGSSSQRGLPMLGVTSVSRPNALSPPTPAGSPPTIIFGHSSQLYFSFTNRCPLPVTYKKQPYASADHLFHAMKFMDSRPLLAEHIRLCSKPEEEATRFEYECRRDWQEVRLVKMNEILEAKFKQHIALKTLLRGTNQAELILRSKDTFWGQNAVGEGRNELGKALVRLRERLLKSNR